MTTAPSTTSRRGTWLVIGLLAVATILVIISRVYRTPSPQDVSGTAEQPDFPAARQGMSMAREGVKLLPAEEQREMDALYAEALQALPPEEKERFLALAQKGATASDSEIVESTDLIQRALSSLPPDKNARLWALVNKAMELQRTQKESAAPAQGAAQ